MTADGGPGEDGSVCVCSSVIKRYRYVEETVFFKAKMFLFFLIRTIITIIYAAIARGFDTPVVILLYT